jgi:CheY-like chemotaxis protein
MHKEPCHHKVLIVEDTPLNMELVADVFTGAGYTVLQAENAEQGIAMAKAESPAIILMDVSLPGMDGLMATRALKGDPGTRHIPVIALTAHAMQGDRERTLAAGCDSYITKPIDTKKLISAVEQFINHHP